jgi:hypothetical protein
VAYSPRYSAPNGTTGDGKVTNDASAQCLGGEMVRVTVPGTNHLVHWMNAFAYNEALLAFLLRH